jgi:hypothetical protein
MKVLKILDLAVSLGDWEYDGKGENMMYPAILYLFLVRTGFL